jgi:hypothetical protein
LEFAQFDPLRPQLFLFFDFSHLSFLFFILQWSESGLELRQHLLDLLAIRWRILGVAYEIFVLVNIRRQSGAIRLCLDKSCAGVIEFLQGTCDGRFLPLTAGLRIQLALAFTHLLSDKLGRKRAVIEEKPSQREGVAVSQTADTGNRFEIRIAGRFHVDALDVVTGEQCR